MTPEQEERMVTAVELIAVSLARQADIAEKGLEVSLEHVEGQKAMRATSQALEEALTSQFSSRK